jgi:hypothetical protein
MGKFAVLFILAGLAVGLWLGFNPAAHRQVVRMWERANAGQASVPLQPLINFRRLNRQAARWLGARDEVAPQAQPANPKLLNWQEISDAFQAFVHAVRQIIVGLLTKIQLAIR